jgi:DNA-binding FadR family transcriptional regulator
MSGNLVNIQLDRINHKNITDLVEERLLEYLKKKAFKPGDPLPTEMELSEALGVSRNILREALSRLRMLGMIETKKKRGMILASPDILGSFERVLDPLIMNDSTLQDIFELRLTLEVGLADILYIRKTKKDVEELEKIALNQSKSVNRKSFRIKHEIAFHGKIYQMTGNKTMQRFQNMLLPIFGYVIELEKVYTPAIVSHLDLVQLLQNGSKEDFRQGMLQHLQHHFKQVK